MFWRVMNIEASQGCCNRHMYESTAEGTQTASLCSIQLYHIKHPDVAGWNTYTHNIQYKVEHINCADVFLGEQDRQSD